MYIYMYVYVYVAYAYAYIMYLALCPAMKQRQWSSKGQGDVVEEVTGAVRHWMTYPAWLVGGLMGLMGYEWDIYGECIINLWLIYG